MGSIRRSIVGCDHAKTSTINSTILWRNVVSPIEKNLLACCRKHILKDVVISEPYIPYIPNDWNGVLVLAESQNLSSSHSDYVDYLNSLIPDKRMCRLGMYDDEIGVWPWDDGALKLAVEAAFSIKAEETAVSNAVLWSKRTDSEANDNPNASMKDASVTLWTEMLDILKPKLKLVVCSGNVADEVIERTNWDGCKTKKRKLRLPSTQAMSRVSGMFEEDDLLMRYPEVKKVLDAHPKWGEGNYKRNKIFFACHAVSLVKSSGH